MIANFYSSGGSGGGSNLPSTVNPPPPPISQSFTLRVVERILLTLANINSKYYDLANRPVDPFDVQVSPEGFTDLFYNYDFNVTHDGFDYKRIIWAGKPIELVLAVGQGMKFVYDTDLSIGADGKIVKYYTVDAPMLAAKELKLPVAAQNTNEVEFTIKGYSDSVHTQDYTVSGLTVSWAGLPPELVLAVGDVIKIVYYANIALASSQYAMETITISPAHILDQGVDLSFLPSYPDQVEVSLEGFPDSSSGSDYEIIFSPVFLDNRRLSWAGKNLAPFVAAGLDLKINYNY